MTKKPDNLRLLQASLLVHFREGEALVKRITRAGGDGKMATDALVYYQGYLFEALPPEPEPMTLPQTLA